MGTYLRGPVTGFGVAFMAMPGAALLLACTNLAGMLLARASHRHREIGIRLAGGCKPVPIVRQLMMGSLLLAIVGGLLGLVIAFAACNLFSSWQPGIDLPINTTLQPDSTVLCFTLAAVLLTTLLFGFAPALQTVRTDLVPSLKTSPSAPAFDASAFAIFSSADKSLFPSSWSSPPCWW